MDEISNTLRPMFTCDCHGLMLVQFWCSTNKYLFLCLNSNIKVFLGASYIFNSFSSFLLFCLKGMYRIHGVDVCQFRIVLPKLLPVGCSQLSYWSMLLGLIKKDCDCDTFYYDAYYGLWMLTTTYVLLQSKHTFIHRKT